MYGQRRGVAGDSSLAELGLRMAVRSQDGARSIDGVDVSPNHHALADRFAPFDNFWRRRPAKILDTNLNNMYIHLIVNRPMHDHHPSYALFALPCACQNLRRVTRLVTRIYDQELRSADIEITQFGLLTALAIMGEANQKALSTGFAMDSTTLTRTLALLRKQGWVHVRPGKDRRERVFRLTEEGKRQIAMAQPHWQAAERRLRKTLGRSGWKQMEATIARVTNAAAEA